MRAPQLLSYENKEDIARFLQEMSRFMQQLADRIEPRKNTQFTVTNLTRDYSYDADATSTAELADVLGTLIATLQDSRIIK